MIEEEETLELHIEIDKEIEDKDDFCAFLTGVLGECEVGEEEKRLYDEEESYEFELRQVPDDNGTRRPVKISGKGYESLTIFLYEPLNNTEIEIIKRRLSIFAEKNKIQIKSIKEIVKTIEYKESRTF